MFHADHGLVQVLAHLFIATLYVIVGIRNARNWTGVIKRMTELGVPLPRLAFPVPKKQRLRQMYLRVRQRELRRSSDKPGKGLF